jgi:hypothetical protein
MVLLRMHLAKEFDLTVAGKLELSNLSPSGPVQWGIVPPIAFPELL